jgi:hypothetical protein
MLRTRIVGGLFFLTAIGVIGRGVHSTHVVVSALAGIACLCLAAMAWRGISTQVVSLDRGAASVHVRTQHIFGSSSVIHRIGDVVDVVLERRPIGDGRDFFRPTFVMRNGTHEAWGTPATGSARADQIAVVCALRAFLGTASSPTAPDGSVAIPRPSTDPTGWNALPPQQRRTARVMLGFTFVVSAVLFTAGSWLAWTQHQLLTSYHPVSAVVQSTDVVSTRDTKGQLIDRPSVRYVYHVDSRSYSSDVVTPLNESRSGDWAHRVAASYQPGESITVYYDPTHPSHAYIEKNWTVLPWILVAGSAVFLGLVMVVALRPG